MKRVLAAVVLLLPLQAVPAEAATPDPVLTAVQRDLGLTADQARARLGDRFGGAWLDGTRLMVGVTDTSEAAKVRTTGARPVLVRRGVRELDAVKATLDRHASEAPGTVSGWHVDPVTNSVVVLTDPTATSAARAFVAGTGADSGPVRLVPVTAHTLLMYEYNRGGDAIYLPGGGTPFQAGASIGGACLLPSYTISVEIRDSLGNRTSMTTGFGCP